VHHPKPRIAEERKAISGSEWFTQQKYDCLLIARLGRLTAVEYFVDEVRNVPQNPSHFFLIKGLLAFVKLRRKDPLVVNFQ